MDIDPARTNPGGDWSPLEMDRPTQAGRLPGDIVVAHQNFSFYFPITPGLLISAILTLVLWLINP